MSAWYDLSDIAEETASIVEDDGKFRVVRPLGLPIRVKRGCLFQKRFPLDKAEEVRDRWEEEMNSRRWTEVTHDGTNFII